MFKNLSIITFMIMMMTGSIISISSNSWMGVWMGLEINLLSFIPLLTKKNNLNNSEASLNYFLIQAFASMILLMSIILFLFKWNFSFEILNNLNNYKNINLISINNLMFLTLMLKIGASPFHFWFPNVMENISWFNGFILMTWQKVAPMFIIPYLILNNFFMYLFILMSSLIGAIGGLNQTSIRKLLAFSSINHIGWMLSAIMFNEFLWMMYFLIYSILNISLIFMMKMFNIFYLSQIFSFFMKNSIIKYSFFMMILSLGGLPPFLGFAPKWMIIQSLIFMNFYLLVLFMILMSLITIYYYLKISFSSYLLNYDELNWNLMMTFKKFNMNMMFLFNFISMYSLIIFLFLFYY
nr:NADH dehydrogenase subunit 2 [Pseudolycoriella hygida]